MKMTLTFWKLLKKCKLTGGRDNPDETWGPDKPDETWGLDKPAGRLGNNLSLLGPSCNLLCPKGFLETTECDFEGTGMCKEGTEVLAPDWETFLSEVLAGSFEGKPFDPNGRPGPVPLLLPRCLLGSIGLELGLLAEATLLEPTLECRCPHS